MDVVEAWQCIGCGKLEAPRPCIGVCKDRKVQLVGRDDYERARAEAAALAQRLAAVEAVLARAARTTPRPGQWEAGYRALQRDARALLRPGRP